nr:MAG TPA: hypothetical protein [Caudoviricetes sp.]
MLSPSQIFILSKNKRDYSPMSYSTQYKFAWPKNNTVFISINRSSYNS